jgi:hypothetical protein
MAFRSAQENLDCCQRLNEREADTGKDVVKAWHTRATPQRPLTENLYRPIVPPIVNDSRISATPQYQSTDGGTYRAFIDSTGDALCKNRRVSSPGVIVLHMFTSGLEKRQAAGANCREIFQALGWHNDCALSK